MATYAANYPIPSDGSQGPVLLTLGKLHEDTVEHGMDWSEISDVVREEVQFLRSEKGLVELDSTMDWEVWEGTEGTLVVIGAYSSFFHVIQEEY